MSEFSAAREFDDIAHTASKAWMVAGLIGGAILGAAAVVVTGGTALVVVAAAAAGATTAGGVGEVLGSMSWAPRHVTGKLTDGSPNVIINDRAAIRAHLSTGECGEHSGSKQLVAEGSIKVYINDFPAARIGDLLTCSAEIASGSSNVFIGGSKIQTDDINPEIPGWVNWLMLGVGAAAIGVLATPAIAVLSTLGGLGGGYAGSYIGGRLFGEGTNKQKWSMLIGGLVGSLAGGKGGARFDSWRSVGRYETTNGVPISKAKFDEIVEMEKGTRPDPDTYLPKDYVENHLKEFESGSSRIVTRSSFEDYGIGKPDAGRSEFVLSKDNAMNIINESKGDPIAIANKLGIPEGQLQNDSLVLVEFKPTELYNPKIPSGNEWGANTQWLPGGKLPKGDLEAVVHTENMINGQHYEVTDIVTGEKL
ncbi:PAAR domain-containing protein [Erwinia mallotivora]|uniref:Membrane protein n=1 Tax=Erwinia mallotivora TaxID=69222 RepID=A0A014NU90_9GAMM|nr:PAAR domain-containing protein [Erwinia mallotivora]EXU77415.1 membrane protein [Erwinia mallotivora]